MNAASTFVSDRRGRRGAVITGGTTGIGAADTERTATGEGRTGSRFEDFGRFDHGDGRRRLYGLIHPAELRPRLFVLRHRQDAGERQTKETVSQIDLIFVEGKASGLQGHLCVAVQLGMFVEQAAVGVEGVRSHAGQGEQTCQGQQRRRLQRGPLAVIQLAITGQSLLPALEGQVARMDPLSQQLFELGHGTGRCQGRRLHNGGGVLRSQRPAPGFQALLQAVNGGLIQFPVSQQRADRPSCYLQFAQGEIVRAFADRLDVLPARPRKHEPDQGGDSQPHKMADHHDEGENQDEDEQSIHVETPPHLSSEF